jgi:hypothetical protein
VKTFEPKLVDMRTASELIRESEKCAVGTRVSERDTQKFRVNRVCVP